MIDRVVIYDLKCGGRPVDSNDIRQMVARCGRTYRKFEQGHAYILHLPDEQRFAEECSSSPPVPLVSSMHEYENLVFHLMSLIARRDITDAHGIEDWFSRSFSASQGMSVDGRETARMMVADGVMDSGFHLSEMAELSCRFYYPFHVVKYLDSKLKVCGFGRGDDMTAYLLAHDDIGPVFTPHYAAFCEEHSVPGCGFARNERTQTYMFHCLLSNYRPTSIGRHISAFVSDCGRFFSMYGMLLESNGYDRSLADVLEKRISLNCTKEEAELMVRLGFADRRVARALLEKGITDSERYCRLGHLLEGELPDKEMCMVKTIFGDIGNEE